MKHKEYFKDFDDFDYESQQVLLSSYNSVLTPNTFHQNKLQSKVFSQKSNNNTESSSSDITDWETDEYVNLDKLIGNIRLFKNEYGNFQLLYNIKDFKSNSQNKSISDGKNYIRLKVYRNPKAGNVSLKIGDVVISQQIDAPKQKIYYRLTFHYADSDERAFILETYSYQEFDNLNRFLNFKNLKDISAAKAYFLEIFANALRNESDAVRLKFIYANIPDSILSNLSTIIDNETFFNHLAILTKYDKDGIFSGLKDGSPAVIQIFKALKNSQNILDYYRKFPEKLNTIYYNLDGNSEYEGQQLSNRKILANILLILTMFSKAETKTDKTFTIGRGYKINTKLSELGSVFGLGNSDSSTFFLQQQKEETTVKTTYNRDEFGVQDKNPTTTTDVKTVDADQGAQYHPLDMVYLKDLSGEKETTYLVPAIYLKALADAEEWEVVMQNIRIAADLVAVVIGVLTLPTGNPYFLLLAIADITLAGADLTIQVFREQILQLEGGEEFLNAWDKVYAVGGALTGGILLLSSFYKLGLKLLTIPEVVKNIKLQNTIKTYMLKVFLEINISNFEGNNVKILTQETEVVTATSGAINEFKLKKLFEKECFLVSGNVAENGKAVEEFALVYKGEVIAQGNKTDFYKKIKEIGRDIYRDGKLTDALENMYKKAIFEFEEFSKSVPEFANNVELTKKSYNLFKLKKWQELEELFKARNINKLWPPFDGFIKKGINTLKRGDQIDRYGGRLNPITGLFEDSGKYFAKKGTKFSERALPAEYAREKILSFYKILKDLPVIEGDAIPWFNQKGLALQYMTRYDVDKLLEKEYIKLTNRIIQ
jgi:hypothetical protein